MNMLLLIWMALKFHILLGKKHKSIVGKAKGDGAGFCVKRTRSVFFVLRSFASAEFLLAALATPD
jgi:hypothetical protein